MIGHTVVEHPITDSSWLSNPRKPKQPRKWGQLVNKHNRKFYLSDMAQAFYLSCMNAVERLKKVENWRKLDDRVKRVDFIRGDRVSKLSLKWEGLQFKSLTVFIDLALCLGYFRIDPVREFVKTARALNVQIGKLVYIAKISRHEHFEDQNQLHVQESTYHFEKKILESCDDNNY